MNGLINPRHTGPWVVAYPAHGITQAQIDATGFLLARFDGTLSSVASFAQMAIVEVVDANNLGVVMAPATYAFPALDGVLADDTLYYPHAATDGAYTATRADLELPVFRYIRRGIVQFLTPDVAMVSQAAGAASTTAYRYMQLEITDAAVQGSFGYRVSILKVAQAYAELDVPNVTADLLQFSTATADSAHHASYGPPGVMIDEAQTANYTNGSDLPVLVTFDFGAGNERVLNAYALTNASDAGNAPAYPTEWNVKVGNDLAAMTVVHSATGQVFAAPNTRLQFNFD